MTNDSIDSESSSIAKEEPTRFRRNVNSALIGLQISVAVAGLLTSLADWSWIAELLANLRMQLIFAGVAMVVLAAMTKRWKLLAIQFVLLGLHFNWIAMSPDRATSSAGPSSLTVTSVNVYINNQHYDMIADVLQRTDSDVIMVTELGPALCEYLRNTLADSHLHVADESYPGPFGVAIFSKYPLSDVDLIGTATTGTTLLATVQTDHHRYRVAAVHPYSPMTPNHLRLRDQHLDTLSREVRTVHQQQPDVPFIVMGDFNLTPWSPGFRTFQQSTGLRHVTDGWGMQPTWYARGRSWFPLGLVLDHCLVSPQLNRVKRQLGPTVVSDHLPLTVHLSHD